MPKTARVKLEDVQTVATLSFTQTLGDFRSILTCKICFKLLYEPYTTHCGHTFCYSCLCKWFNNSGNSKKKTCPDCRDTIVHAPAPAYMVRDMSHKLMSQLYLLGDEEDSLEQHLKLQAEESALVDEHKSNKDLRTGGLFQGKFRPNPGPRFLPAIHDVEDGVTRCPSCAWELEGGDPRCNHCGYWLNSDGSSSYDSDYEPTDDSVFSQGLPMAGESEYEDDDELDGEMDDEDDDGEVGFPIVSGSPMGVFDHEAFQLASETFGTAEDFDTMLEQQSDDEDEDNIDEDGDSLMGGFVVDDDAEDADEDEDSDESSVSTPRQSSSPPAPRGFRRSNAYVVDSDSDDEDSGAPQQTVDSDSDEGGPITNGTARRRQGGPQQPMFMRNAPQTVVAHRRPAVRLQG